MKHLCVILSIALVSLITGCGNSYKYTYDNIGVYDTKTRQYIKIDDSRESIENVLGDGETEHSDIIYKYDDDLSIVYINDKADTIGCSQDSSRYELFGGLNCNSSITDFIDNYKYIYDDGSKRAAVFLQKCGNKVMPLKKDKLLQICQNLKKQIDENPADREIIMSKNPLYYITITYHSYDSIYGIVLTKLKSPMQEERISTLTEISDNR